MKTIFICIGCIALLVVGFVILTIIAAISFIITLGNMTEKEDRYHEPASSENTTNHK